MKIIKCSDCNKRIFDISDYPKENFEVEIKCSRCRNIIKIKFRDKNIKISISSK